jgi:hypothetical protein
MEIKEEIKDLKSRIPESNSQSYRLSVTNNRTRLENQSNNRNNNSQNNTGRTNEEEREQRNITSKQMLSGQLSLFVICY